MINLRSIAYLLFFFSGLAALVYEVVWTRQLSALFGSTAESAGVVLAVFLGAMAAGSAAVGRAADRIRRPFLLFATLEGMTGLYALPASLAYPALERFYFSGGPPQPGLNVVLTAAYLFIPCFLMGGALPALSRFCAGEDRSRFGRAAGGLYGMNTLGAAAGALLAGFLFLERFGMAATLRLAGSTNLAVAAAAFVLFFWEARGRGDRPGRRAGAEAAGAVGTEKGAPPPAPPAVPVRVLIFLAFFLAGSATLAHEVLWTRILSQFFRNSVYSFSSMLFSVLIGLAAGGGVGAWLARRTRHPFFALALAEGLAGTLSICSIFLVLPFTDLSSYARLLLSFGGFDSFGRLALFEVLAAACLVFPPAFFMGFSFPFMAQAAWRPATRFGGYVGDLQAVVTAGNVAGALVMAFWLIPAAPDTGIAGTLLGDWILAAAACLGAALLFLAGAVRRAGKVHLALATAAVLCGAVFGAYLLHARAGALRFWRDTPEGERLLFYRSGRNAEVAVVDGPEGRILKVNNTSSLGGTGGEYLETRLGILPVLLKGGSDRALLMGLGTGNTLYGMLLSGARDVDCLELVPGVAEASRAFHRFDPATPVGGRLRIVLGDARVFLRNTDEKYDLIVGDLYFPWRSEAGFMYTEEHFRRVRDHLTDDGVFIQWLPLHQLRWEDFGIIGYTFSENVFEHVAVFLAAPDAAVPIVGLAGSRRAFRLNPPALQEALDRHFQSTLLERFGAGDAMELTALYLGNAWLFRTHFHELKINTEDRTLVEFRAARIFEDPDRIAFNNFRKLSEPGFKEYAVPLLDLPAEMETRARVELEERVKRTSESLRILLGVQALFLREHYLANLGVRDRPEDRKKLREQMGVESLNAFRYAPDYRLARENLLRLWKLYVREKEFYAANNLMYRALAVKQDDPEFYNKLGLGLLLEGKYDEAAACLYGAVARDETNLGARANLAVALFLQGDRVRAREQMKKVKERLRGKRLPPLTEALSVLILEEREKAEPLLAPFRKDPSWKGLVEAALDRAGGSDHGGGEKAP